MVCELVRNLGASGRDFWGRGLAGFDWEMGTAQAALT